MKWQPATTAPAQPDNPNNKVVPSDTALGSFFRPNFSQLSYFERKVSVRGNVLGELIVRPIPGKAAYSYSAYLAHRGGGGELGWAC